MFPKTSALNRFPHWSKPYVFWQVCPSPSLPRLWTPHSGWWGCTRCTTARQHLQPENSMLTCKVSSQWQFIKKQFVKCMLEKKTRSCFFHKAVISLLKKILHGTSPCINPQQLTHYKPHSWLHSHQAVKIQSHASSLHLRKQSSHVN